jgi:hypothetical protein
VWLIVRPGSRMRFSNRRSISGTDISRRGIGMYWMAEMKSGTKTVETSVKSSVFDCLLRGFRTVQILKLVSRSLEISSSLNTESRVIRACLRRSSMSFRSGDSVPKLC